MDALKVDGKLKALPNYLGIRALLYHENILKAAGISAPPKTWDELLNAAQTVKDKTGKEIFGIAGAGVRSPQELIMYLAQNGVTLADKQADGKYMNTWQDNPDQLAKAAEVFEFYQDLVAKGAVKADARTWGWEEEDQNFVLGQYAMVVNGPWIEGRASENPEGMKDVKVADSDLQKQTSYIHGNRSAVRVQIEASGRNVRACQVPPWVGLPNGSEPFQLDRVTMLLAQDGVRNSWHSHRKALYSRLSLLAELQKRWKTLSR